MKQIKRKIFDKGFILILSFMLFLLVLTFSVNAYSNNSFNDSTSIGNITYGVNVFGSVDEGGNNYAWNNILSYRDNNILTYDSYNVVGRNPFLITNAGNHDIGIYYNLSCSGSSSLNIILQSYSNTPDVGDYGNDLYSQSLVGDSKYHYLNINVQTNSTYPDILIGVDLNQPCKINYDQVIDYGNNIIRYLSIPSNTILTNGYLNLSGYLTNNIINYCYQESANTTNQGGLDGSCSKNYSGNYSMYDPANGWNSGEEVSTRMFDGDWNTLESGSPGGAFLNITYIKPANSNNNSVWKVKDTIYLGSTLNHTLNIDNDCWNAYNNKLILQIQETGDGSGAHYYWNCYNGTNFKTLSNYGRLVAVYEEAINWSIDTFPSNISLFIDSNNVFNYNGIFNQSNNKTSNLANSINNYLSTCTYNSGYCQVPFIFSSDTSGILQYSNLQFDNNGFIENSITYNNNTFSGKTEKFSINITTNSLSSVNFVYNGTNYTVDTINSLGNGYYTVSKTLVIPLVNTITNISFYWNFNINGTYFNSTINNQTVSNIFLTSNCAGNYTFMNITNIDEETLNSITGTVEYTLYLQSSNNQITITSGNVTGTNLTICSNQNLTNSYINYNLQLRYYSNGYFYKTYNIQNSAITNIPINIYLYYLNSSIGTSFKINYVDFNYLTYPNAIIQIQRQYLPTNSYNLVEIPRLDNNGLTTGSFNTNNIRYKLIVINNGIVLDTFDNIFPSCQNIVLGTCEINLRGTNNAQTSTTGDFTYTLVKSTNSITLTYIIPSGTPRSIEFLTNQNSRFLDNITTCDTTLFSSGGTITCPYNQTIGDSIISTQIINSDGSHLYGSIQISEDLSSFFLLNNYFIAFVLILLLALIFISSGVMLIIVGVVGLIYLGLIFLLRGFDFTTVVGSIAFLIIGAVIIIFHIAKKEETS